MKQTDSNLKEIMLTCASFVEEVYVETRKGVPQTHYIVEITEDKQFWNWETNQIENVPDWSVGYWRTDCADDNTYYSYGYRIKNDYWVKVERKEIFTYEYEVV